MKKQINPLTELKCLNQYLLFKPTCKDSDYYRDIWYKWVRKDGGGVLHIPDEQLVKYLEKLKEKLECQLSKT